MSETVQVWKSRYEIERPLGRGGMGAVFLAKDRQLLSKYVVIKVLLDDTASDAWMQQKFKQEMEALARIDHPGVVGVLDTGVTPQGKPFLVMQYVEGETLHAVIGQGPMEFPRVARIVRQVAQAVGAAHEKGVWHRDLKPENIMLQRSGGEDYVKLIDFGIAGIQNSQFTGAATKVAGTLAYMAPEQFAGHPCAASDIYALGVVAYEMLTGRTPFPSSSMTHLVQDGLTWDLPRRWRPDLPAGAERAILKALAFRPEQRQASIRELGDDLYAALTGGEASRKASSGELRKIPSRDSYNVATEEAGNPETPSKLKSARGAEAPAVRSAKSSRTPILAGLAAVVVLGGGGAAAWKLLQKPEPLTLSYVTNIDKNVISFQVTNSKPGYLYILNYGQDQGKWTFNLLEPRFGRSAQRNANESKRVPEENGFEPEKSGEKNIPYLVWAADLVPEMEALKTLKQVHGVAIVDDPAQVARVRQYLDSHHSEASRKGASTEVRTDGKILVYPISLERQ
jgi:serine/threonine-protein kinase